MRFLGRILAAAVFLVLMLVLVVTHAVGAVQAQSGPTTVSQQQAQLQSELNQITSQINQLQSTLASTKQTQTTLQGELTVLSDQITVSELAIERRNLTIEALSQSIQDKEDAISGLNNQLGAEEESLASILRETNELDNSSLLLLALSAQDVSGFLADLAQFAQINENMQQSFTSIQTNTQINQAEKTDLESQLQEETQLLQAQQLQAQEIQTQKQQKADLLAQTKGQEKAYQQIIASKQQTASEIRAALFQLTGTHAIAFGTALQYANVAAQKTGIRPAFLLGIIAEESNLGQNVGTGSWQADMSPANQPAFQAITASLGLDPNTMPVSKKQWYGWGGAMGPAQFIPLTWAQFAGYAGPSYTYDPGKDRVGALTGDHPPNPWNPEDAFMAAALYLTDDGAAARTPSAEFRAAMCYLTGCGGVNNPDLQFYGNQVASLASQFQDQIDILNGQG